MVGGGGGAISKRRHGASAAFAPTLPSAACGGEQGGGVRPGDERPAAQGQNAMAGLLDTSTQNLAAPYPPAQAGEGGEGG